MAHAAQEGSSGLSGQEFGWQNICCPTLHITQIQERMAVSDALAPSAGAGALQSGSNGTACVTLSSPYPPKPGYKMVSFGPQDPVRVK